MLRRLNFFNWSISLKLGVIFLLVVAVPALLVAVPVLSIQRENFAERQTESRLEALGPFSAFRVQQTFQNLVTNLDRLASDPTDYANVERYLYLAPWPISSEARQRVEQFMDGKINRYLAAAPSLSRVRFYDYYGDLLADGMNQGGTITIHYTPAAVPSHTPGEQRLESGALGLRSTISPIYQDHQSAPSIDVIFTLRPSADLEALTAPIGYVVFTQNLALAAQDPFLPDVYEVSQYGSDAEQETHAFLLNAQGQLASLESDFEFLGESVGSDGVLSAQQGKTGVATYHSPILKTEVIGYYSPVTIADGPTLILLVEVPVRVLQTQARQEGLLAFVVISLGILVLGWAASLVATALIARPIGRLTQAAQQIATGRLDIQMEKQSRQDEIGVLTNSFADMASQLLTAINRLQTGVHERTRNLETILGISRALTSIRDLDTLLQEVVNLIRDQFEHIYHAQVFLVEPQSNRAVLRASTGDAGRKLLARGHYLEIGSQSVIGSVTATGHAVVALDTSHNPIHRRNEFLPDTRAEMALPLRLGNRIFGALDLQSTLPDAFTEQDVELFQGMADQIMVAIDNARLFDESSARLHEIERLNRTLTSEAWRDTEQQHAAETLSAAAGSAVANTDGWSELQLEAIRAERTVEAVEGNNIVIAVPVLVRDQALGAIEWRVPQSRYTTDTRQMAQELTARLALTAENIRLFEQTQRALAETERLYETARTISSTPDLETIYQLIAEQLSSAPLVDDVEILLSGPDPALVQYLESTYRWSRRTGDTGPATRERLRVLPMTPSEEPLLPASGPVMYSDVRQEMRPDHPLYTKLSHLNTQSVVLAPLSAAGRWFGIVLCSSRQRGGFQPTYVAFASALADQLAIAIENRRLFEEAQLEARRARALAEAGQLASQIGGDYEAGMQNLFQAVSGPGNYDRWWFGLLSETDGRVVLTRAAAAGPVIVEVVDVQRDRNALAEAARIGEIVLVNDPTDHPAVSEETFESALEWAKHLAMPVHIGSKLTGVLLLGRSQEAPNLDERDIQLAATLASQISVATQNQQLFSEAESQRQNLQTIVNTMPTGILVMDRAGRIVLSNDRLTDLLGPDMRPGTSEHPQPYPVLRAGTNEPYPTEEWPLSKVFASGEVAIVDDMIIQHPVGYELMVLAQAAPIRDADGTISMVVGVFQDITELQQLERALQDSLRETTLLYEASRSISRTTNLDDLLQTLLWQVSTLQPDRIYLLTNEEGRLQLTVNLAASYPPGEPVTFAPLELAPVLEREPMIIDRATEPETLGPLMDGLGLQTLGTFPLMVREQIHGWIVTGFAVSDALGAEQRRFLTTLADQAAVTIENQRLLLQTSDALEETAILYHASRIITDATTPNEILAAFVYHATTVQVHFAALYLLLGEAEQTSYAAVELVTSEGTHSSAKAVGTRYRAEEFPLWELLVAPKIARFPDISRMSNLDEQVKMLFAELELQSAVVIPLHTSERPLGVLLIGLDAPWVQAEKDIRVYEALADQAAVSLENTRLYQQAQRRARQLITSAEISRAVTSILRLDDLLPQVVDLIRDAFSYDHAQVFLINDEGTQAELVASTGEAGRKLLERHHSLPVGSMSVIGQVTATRQPTIALDTADARVVHRPNPLLPRTRSEMALPLIARGEILGALDVQSNQPGAFTDEDIRVLASLADMVATAIDNARLFEASREHADEMAFLFNVTTAATTTPDLQVSLNQVVAILRESMAATRVSIFLPDETGQNLIRGAEVGVGSDETDTATLSVERGLLGWVAHHNEAVVIGDLSQDPRRMSSEPLAGSVMAVPLQSAGVLIGVVAIESDRIHAFDHRDLQLLQTLSGSLAAIIQNSRLLREVQSANERLLEVDRLKTNFLAAMSHELRTPLNSIIGFSRVILKGIDGPLTETQEQDLSTIYDSGKHLLGLVNDILDQAKIEAGKMELAFGYFKIQNVINGVMSTAIGLTRDKSVRLHSEIADDLLDAYGDEHRTRQVLLNLVSNASKFTDEGSITVSAFLVQEDDRQNIQVSVTDTGIGIAEQDMHLLFVPFQQIDNSLTRKAGGTGMGLPLAKSMVELQGGRIWVESRVGVGSTFNITIPTAPLMGSGENGGTDQDLAAIEAQPASTSKPHELRSEHKTVVVIEQEVEAINTVRRQLSQAGYAVIGITQPEELNKAVMAHRPRLIVLDVDLRNQAGWNVLSTLKSTSTTQHIPVIVCTSNSDVQRGLELGAAAYLLKPVSEAHLIEAVLKTDAEQHIMRPCILLIDDKPESIRPLREALQASQQYDIVEATSGQQAIEIIQQPRPIDLVVLDLRMPEIDGFVVLQALRGIEWTANIPVLVLTAEDVTADERARLAAVDVYRKGDADEERLIQHVAEQLGSTRRIES